MEWLRRERKELQRLPARAMGVNVEEPRVLASQARSIQVPADVLRLPVDISRINPLQSSSGGTYFMADFSPIDGPDELA